MRDIILHYILIGLSKRPSEWRQHFPIPIFNTGIYLEDCGDRLSLKYLGKGGIVVAIPDSIADKWIIAATFLGERRNGSSYLNDFSAFWEELVVPNLDMDTGETRIGIAEGKNNERLVW